MSNIVPARADLLQEMREIDARVLARLDRECQALARTVARRRTLKVSIERIAETAPATCAPRVRRAVVEACRDLRLRFREMPSAAGHDAQNLAT